VNHSFGAWREFKPKHSLLYQALKKLRIEVDKMALTGRFNLRRTFTGRITLVVEEEVKTLWSRLSGNTKVRRRWRDAKVMDLAAPELRSLVDLRFRPHYLGAAHDTASWPPTRRQLEALPPKTLYYENVDEDGRPTAH
jgi:hypothetical protein